MQVKKKEYKTVGKLAIEIYQLTNDELGIDALTLMNERYGNHKLIHFENVNNPRYLEIDDFKVIHLGLRWSG